MEAEVTQHIPAIIEQAAKSPLGLFALMVIALSILGFVFFRGASERTRVAMFVLLFFGVAAFGVAAIRVTPGETTAPAGPAAAAADIEGRWFARIEYDWGDSYDEEFALSRDGTEVLGTASYLGRKRALFDGRVVGDRVSFVTRTRELMGGDSATRESVHHYIGKVAGDRIQFTLRSEGGFTEHVPLEFIAVRTP